MLKLCRATILSTMLILGVVSASAQTTDQQENLSVLQKEVACLLVNEYTVRHFNLFASQLDMINDAGNERRKIVLPIIAMSMLIKMDMDKRITELANSGVSNAVIDAMVQEVTDAIFNKYSHAYIDSTDYDKATEFIRSLSMEQDECESWFKATFGEPPMPTPAPNEKKNGGVDG